LARSSFAKSFTCIVVTEPEQEWPTNPNYFPKWRRSEMPTISFSTKTVLRAGSLVAGLGSVIWGLYAVLAFQVVVTTTNSQSPANPYSNYTFVTFVMYEAVIIGLFALVLALLSR